MLILLLDIVPVIFSIDRLVYEMSVKNVDYNFLKNVLFCLNPKIFCLLSYKTKIRNTLLHLSSLN